MRTNCRYYESRTYASGEVVRKCRIDLAPEAPWRCPDECSGFELRRFDAGWQIAPLERGYAGAGPEPEGDDVAALLDAAEDIVNAAAPGILSEFEKKPGGRFARKKNKRRK